MVSRALHSVTLSTSIESLTQLYFTNADGGGEKEVRIPQKTPNSSLHDLLSWMTIALRTNCHANLTNTEKIFMQLHSSDSTIVRLFLLKL